MNERLITENGHGDSISYEQKKNYFGSKKESFEESEEGLEDVRERLRRPFFEYETHDHDDISFEKDGIKIELSYNNIPEKILSAKKPGVPHPKKLNEELANWFKAQKLKTDRPDKHRLLLNYQVETARGKKNKTRYERSRYFKR
ncbi:hypothetical protein L0Y46_03785 [bacterium]|nr:hypothetical protein [bacterium]